MLYKFRIEVESDDPTGLTDALAMEAEHFGIVRVAEMEPLEEQTAMQGVLGARAQLEAALERRQA